METKRRSARVAVSLLALAGLAVFSLFAVGGSLEPSAPPGPTMKTLDEVEPRVAIHAADLPLTITGRKSYYLVEDVNFTDDANNAITIECNDVTIDLMGYTLKGPDSGFKSGIYMNGCANVEIRNGTIRDFGGQGIYEANTNGCCHRVINVRLVSNGQYGIILRGEGHLVKDCFVAFNESGGIVAGDIVKGCSTVTGNIVKNNGGDGIQAGEGSIVTGNTVKGSYNRGHGIYVQDLCIVTGNILCQNGGDGIQAKSGCTISANTCDDNGQFDGAGIRTTGTDNRIEKNNLTNTDRGLEIDSTGSMISDNIVKGNTDNYDIAAGNQLNILLCEVPETIDWPATVTLAGSLKLTSTTEHAITVDSNDVTIDLAGFSLIGPDSGTKSGIYMNGRSNVEVRNGTVRNFCYGIFGVGVSGKNHRVIDVRSVFNGQGGIVLLCNGLLVKGCTASDNGDSATGEAYGIFAGAGSTVTGNTAYNNGTSATYAYGIRVGGGSTMTGNTAYDNGDSAGAAGAVCGIYASSGCTVTGNTAYDNGTSAGGTVYGIYLGGNNLVDQNTAYSNGTGAGSATNMSACGSCTFGTNHAP